MDPDSRELSELNAVIRDLQCYSSTFYKQRGRLSCGFTLLHQNLIDIQNCGVIKQHQRLLRSINKSIRKYELHLNDEVPEVSDYDEVDNYKEVDDEKIDDTDHNVDPPSSNKAIIVSCPSLKKMTDVIRVLWDFDNRMHGLSSLSTSDHKSFKSSFECCMNYVNKFRELLQQIVDGTNELSANVKIYLNAISSLSEKDRRIAGPELLSGMKNGLTTLLEEMDYLIDGICKLLTTVEVLVVSFKQKESRAKQLWLNGQTIMHRYLMNDSIMDRISIRPSILCWLKAERKSVRRSMFTCKLTTLDQMNFILGNGNVLVGNTVTISSTDGSVIKADDIPIAVLIPYLPQIPDNQREISVLTKTTPSAEFQETPYQLVKMEGQPVIEIKRQELSFLSVIPLFRPVQYEQTVDDIGAIIHSPNDSTVKLIITTLAIPDQARIAIQTIREENLPVSRVQFYHTDLLKTSSMVYPKLPPEMTKSAQVVIQFDNANDMGTKIHAMVHYDQGWTSTMLRTSLQFPGSYTVNINHKAKQVILMHVNSCIDVEEMNEIAQAMSDAINEKLVNFIVFQHPENRLRVYIECCLQEYAYERGLVAKRRGYQQISKNKDVWLKEGAVVNILTSGYIVFDLPRGKTQIRVQFFSQVFRPIEAYIRPHYDCHWSQFCGEVQGFVQFAADIEDVSSTEKPVQDEDEAGNFVFLSAIPITITKKETHRRPEIDLNRLNQCARAIKHSLQEADLVNLMKVIPLHPTAKERLMRDPESLSLISLLNVWYQTIQISIKDFAESLKKIGKAGIAEHVEEMDFTDEE